jgi:hypothetical protein
LLAAGLDDCEHRSFPCSARLSTQRICAAGFFAVDRNAALANRGLTLGFEARAQNQKRGLAAALEQG